MKKLSALLVALLSTAYKNGGEKSQEFADLLEKLKSDDLKEEDLNEAETLTLIKELDKARVKDLRTKSDDSGYKRAQAEILSKRDADLREKYNVDQDEALQGEALISAILEANSKKSDKELTDDAVKKHPAYIKAIDAHKEQLAAKETEFNTKLEQITKSQSAEKTFETISQDALTHLRGKNPILSADAKKAANQEQLLIKELKARGYQFEMQDGKKVVLDKDGKLVEDEHGHRVSFESIVDSIAEELYDFKAASTDRTAPHGKTGDQTQGNESKKFSGVMPKNEDEYIKAISNEETPLADRLALKDAWKAKAETV